MTDRLHPLQNFTRAKVIPAEHGTVVGTAKAPTPNVVGLWGACLLHGFRLPSDPDVCLH